MRPRNEPQPALPAGVPAEVKEHGESCRYRWHWRYLDTLIVVRYDGPAPRQKTFRPYYRAEGERWKAGLPPGLRPLYAPDGLPTAHDETIHIVEGEKCADATRGLGLPCVAIMGGAQSVSKTDWTPLKHIQCIVIMPDNDAPGKVFAEAVARAVAALPGARDVLIAKLPGVPAKGDVCDWIAARVVDWDEFSPLPIELVEGLRAELLAEIEAHAHPAPPLAVTLGNDWPAPVPLPAGPSVEAFDPIMLAETVRPWIMDIAERLQCPPDYPAAAFLVAFGSLVGRQVGIRPKRHSDWCEVPNLWGCIVGPPGTLKTPAVAEIMRPLKALEAQTMEEHRAARLKSAAAQIVAKAQGKTAEKEIEKAVKSGNTLKAQAMAEDLLQAEDDAAAPPCRRYICNSTTIEKLGELLTTTPSGLLILRDELAGFLRSLEKQGYEEARAFYLEAWNGMQGFTYDTIKRGTVAIPRVTVSIFGTIQPGPLAAYLRENCRHGGQDGLVPRFQLMVYPDPAREWRNVDRWPNTSAREAADELIRWANQLDIHALGAVCEDGSIPYIRFSEEAQRDFDVWHAELEGRLRGNALHPILLEHLNKYRGLVPALSLLLHLAERKPGPVSAKALAMALAWAEYLESHARRVYSLFLRSDDDAARMLVAKLEAGAVPSPFTERDIKRKAWGGLDDTNIGPALEVLQELGYIRKERVAAGAAGGRPTFRYHLHPDFLPRMAANG